MHSDSFTQKNSDSFTQKVRASLDRLLEVISTANSFPEQQPLLELLELHAHAIEDVETDVQHQTAQLQQALKYQSILRRIIDRVRHRSDEHHILQTVVQELRSGLNLTGCDSTLYGREVHSAVLDPATGSKTSRAGEHLVKEVSMLMGQYSPGPTSQFCLLQERRTVLICQIVDTQEVLGDLLLYRSSQDIFCDSEVDLVQQVANQCAIAIRHARLHQITAAHLKELERLNQAKDDFLNTISYELRLPMSNMKMAIQMLRVALEREDLEDTIAAQASESIVHPLSKAFRYLDILQNECEREAKLIEDLLDLQQLEDNDAMSLILSAISLEEWLPYVVNPLQTKFQEQEIDLRLEIEPELPPLMCDQISLSRIISELLNNAYKYTPTGEQVIVRAKRSSEPACGLSEAKRVRGVRAFGSLQGESSVPIEMIAIEICNTGAEISKDELSQIFDKFHRIAQLDLRKEGGTGLGLPLVQKLVTRLGGEVYAASNASQTCFTIHLPITSSG